MNLGVVLVTYNRLEKLKKALLAYEQSTQLPEYIIIVNNNSIDGTAEYLQEWCQIPAVYMKKVINLEDNTGGSGGFHIGLERACCEEVDWVWVADDDAYPHLNALEVTSNYLDSFKEQGRIDEISALCGAVYINSRIQKMQRRRYKKKLIDIKDEAVGEEEYLDEYFYIDMFSYVGTVINVPKMRKIGTTIKDYFIYYDDTEHSLRLRKEGDIVCVPKIKIIHDMEMEIKNKDVISWKSYYGFRNRLDMLRRNYPYRFFVFASIKNIFMASMEYLFLKNRIKGIVRFEATRDAIRGRLGIHEKYKPGWKC